MLRPRRREWEAEYVSEYCVLTWPTTPVVYHCRLGTWPTPLSAPELEPAEQAMLRVRMRWADAVVIEPTRLVVIEGKLRASEFLKGLGELQVYTHLVEHTPEFKDFSDRKIQGCLLIPLDDPVVNLVARQRGLVVAVYKPSFWAEYTKILLARQTRPIRPEEQKLIGAT